jgi:iron complex outermembrane receptor protein
LRRSARCYACAGTLLIAIQVLADDGISGLGEVIVTARKREEVLQEVPMSLTVLGGDELQSRSIERLSDLGQLTPNFFYGQQVQSGSSAGQLFIRGVGQHDTNSTFNSSVGLYVDGVYISRATADDLALRAAQQVEVLYGPQGSLFGKNTNGGAVSIATTKPDVSASGPSGSAEVSGGSLRALHASGDLQLPLAPQVAALNLSMARDTDEGYGRRIDGEREANQNRTALRAQLLLRPAQDWEAVLRLDGSRFNEHSGAYKLVSVRTASTIPQLYAADTPYRYDDRWLTAGSLDTDGTGPNRNAGTVAGASLTVSWSQPWATVKSVGAYRRLSVESDFDPDGSPLAVLDVFNHVEQQQLSEEIQAAGESLSRRVQWVSGLYYFHETIQDNQPAHVGLEYFHGAANFDPELHVVNANLASYGQINVGLWRELKLTLGGRVGRDAADVGRVQVDFPDPTIEQPYVRRSASRTSFLPRVGLQYQWTYDLMSYLSASEGSKSGGFNGRAGSIAEFNGFSPEKVWTYEAGLRSEWFSHRLRFNATGYYSAYTDFQILLNSSVTDPASGNPVAFSYVGNIPRTSVRGTEVALTALPVTGLRLDASLGITVGRYDEVLPGAPVTRDSQFVDTPTVTIGGSGEYAWRFSDRQQVIAHLDYVHKSAIQYDYGNSPLVEQRPFGLVNARLTWLTTHPSLSLYAFVTNLGNVHFAIGGLDDGPGGSLGEVVKLMGPPREWGLGAKFSF